MLCYVCVRVRVRVFSELNLFSSYAFLLFVRSFVRSLFPAIKWCLDDECYVTEYVKADFFHPSVCQLNSIWYLIFLRLYFTLSFFLLTSLLLLLLVLVLLLLLLLESVAFCCSFTSVLLCALLLLLLFKSMVGALNLMRCIPNHQLVCLRECIYVLYSSFPLAVCVSFCVC